MTIEKIKEIIEKYTPYAELVDIENLEDKNPKITLKDKEYGGIETIKVSSLLKHKGWKCLERSKQTTRKDNMIKKIEKHIEEMNKNQNRNIVFLGFTSPIYEGIKTARINLKDIDTEEIGDILLQSFLNTDNWETESIRKKNLENMHEKAKAYWKEGKYKDRKPGEKAVKRKQEKTKTKIIEDIKKKISECSLNLKIHDFELKKSTLDRTASVILEDENGNLYKRQIDGFLKRGITFDKGKAREYTFEERKPLIDKITKDLGLTFVEVVGEWKGNRSIIKLLRENKELLTISLDSLLYRSFKGARSCENQVWKIICDIAPDKFEREHKIIPDENCNSNRSYFSIDFYSEELGLAVEFNGNQHYEFSPWFHNTYEDFLKQINRDNDIKRICKEKDIKLLSIPYCDRNNLEKILKSFIEEGRDITTPMKIELPDGEDIST